MASLQLTIYLLKEDHHAEEGSFRDGELGALEAFPVTVPGAEYARIYLRRNRMRLPDWRELFPGLNWNRYRTNSFSGLLIVGIHGRRFAIAAGGGRHLLDPFAVEENFGFKVVINSVNPQQIRKIEKKTINQNPISSIDQLTRTSSLDAFRLDYYTDIISKIRASSSVTEFGSIVDGRDALQISMESSVDALAPILRRCLEAYRSTTYRQYFPQIDNVGEVHDRALLEALDEILIERLNRGDHDHTWAAMPEIVLDDDFSAIVYSNRPNAARYHDVELHDCLEKYTVKARTFTKSDLERDTIYIRKANGDTFPRWRVWKCIYAEVRRGDQEYVLIEGKWFRVSHEYIERLDGLIAVIPRSNYALPVWLQHVHEKDYLRSLANSTPPMLVLDRDLIQLAGQSPIELCDLFIEENTFAHVKRYGSSQVLSHLFDQGRVSAQLFLRDSSFRVAAQQKCAKFATFPIDSVPNARDYTVAYLVGSKYADAQVLPLFARVVLVDTFMELSNYGYNVTLGFIPIELA